MVDFYGSIRLEENQSGMVRRAESYGLLLYGAGTAYAILQIHIQMPRRTLIAGWDLIGGRHGGTLEPVEIGHLTDP